MSYFQELPDQVIIAHTFFCMQIENISSNKRILINTIILYSKMLVATVVTLYSARLLLQALGASDYGLFNVVAGLIAMLSFVNGAMSNAVQRFFSFTLGKKDTESLKSIFNSSKDIHYLIALIVTVMLEIVGPLMIELLLNIDADKHFVAHIAFQCMVLSYIVQVIATPLDALITAFERFYIFAVIELLATILKLFVAILLLYLSGELIIWYSILFLLVVVIQNFMKYVYCRVNFKGIVNYTINLKTKLDRELLSFAGWNMIESLAWIGKNQGVAIVINVCSGTVVNAAYGIANQVNSQINFFSSTIQKTFRPQIIQSAGNKNFQKMVTLSNLSTKLSFYLMLILSLPIIVNLDYILKIWLKDVPAYTSEFCCWTLLATCVVQLSTGLNVMVQAIGNIKKYNLVVSILTIFVIPVSYSMFIETKNPVSVLIVCFVFELMLLLVRYYMAWGVVKFDAKEYFFSVMAPLSLIFTLSFLPQYYLSKNYPQNGFSGFMIKLILSFFYSTIIIILLSNSQEKSIMSKPIMKLLSRFQ